MSQPLASAPRRVADHGAPSHLSGPTILIVVWPEYGHVVTLLALAKQLRERHYRVVFAGVRTFEQPMRALGYEYANLSAARPEADGFGTLAAAAGIPWALYETDLPRALDRCWSNRTMPARGERADPRLSVQSGPQVRG